MSKRKPATIEAERGKIRLDNKLHELHDALHELYATGASREDTERMWDLIEYYENGGQ